MLCISTIPTDHLIALCAPVEPMCFTSCDGPHSGVPDDRRPPHRIDALEAGLVALRWPHDDLETVAGHIADAWAGYGFTAADLAAWVQVDITEPDVAAECRTSGFNPQHEGDRAFLQDTVGIDLDEGLLTAEQAMAAYKGAP